MGEKSRTASNKGTQTKTLITEFFEGRYIAKNIKPKEEPKPVPEKPREVETRELFPGQEGRTATGGDGISFSLGNRSYSSLPSPEYSLQKSGTVVVEITVDRNGNVTQVRGGVRGSTTYDTELIRTAEAAARRAKFNVSPTAPAYQTGTITYVFKLQQ